MTAHRRIVPARPPEKPAAVEPRLTGGPAILIVISVVFWGLIIGALWVLVRWVLL